MPVDAAVAQLVEEALDSGRTPEAVCAGAPHLLPAVRARWEVCRRLSGLLDDVLPPPTAADGTWSPDARPPVGPAPDDVAARPDRLPAVPGYEIEAVLGRGGMGVVYRALDVRLRRRVALKMILSGEYASRAERARFLREARAVAALRHPHVVQVYDADEHDGRPYYTMELVDGGTLAAKLGGAPLPPGEAAALIEPLARAVEAAHDVGIVHRDLKPQNVLLDRDGTPKVADFGLARRTDAGDETVTLSGPGPGTPSYMAPEQVSGARGAVGPAADVYGLGAVLYEVLTGRPPFRGDSPVETARQVLSDDPAPPSRLNGRVPRDLETICLKCLHKAPARRYPTAAALAEDVRRFRAGEPIAARRAGRVERAAKWARRRPAVAALWATAAVMLVAAGGGALWWASERATAAQAVAGDLGRAEQLQREARWAEANALLDRAELGLGGRRLRDLSARLDRARRDAALVARLDDIRLNRLRLKEDFEENADSEYEAALRAAGFFDGGGDADAVAARIRTSNVNRAVAAAVYDWLRRVNIYIWGRPQWLWAVARQVDPSPDPTGWRRRVLDPATWQDPAALEALAQEPAAADQSPELLMFLGMRLEIAQRDSLPLLLRVHQANPGDFWANMELAGLQRKRKDMPEALRYAQAAFALRPRDSWPRYILGIALLDAGRAGDAAAFFRESLRLDPELYGARPWLARSLIATGAREEGAAEFEKAVRESPTGGSWEIRIEFARCLESVGRIDDAAAQYRYLIEEVRRAVERDREIQPPSKDRRDRITEVRGQLAAMLVRQGRAAEALDGWRAEFDGPTQTAELAWAGYAEFCLFLGRDDEYRRACRVLLDRAEADAEPRVWEVIGRTCLLLPPAAPADLRRATALIDRALATQPPGGQWRPYFLAAQALADYRGGRYGAALAHADGEAAGVLGPLPSLVAAMARWRLGQPAEARAALARAAVRFDWSPAEATYVDAWMYHVLRRQAEAMILPDLPAFLDGAYQPRSTDERVALAAVCQATGRTAAEARLWADALTADPALAAGCRAKAIRAAASAGCGVGTDAAGLDAAARAAWRAAARRWLADELDAAELLISGGPPHDRSAGRAIAANARSHAAVLRDRDRRAPMPPEERAVCDALFARADHAAAAPDN